MKNLSQNFNAFFCTLIIIMLVSAGSQTFAQVVNNGVYFIQVRHSGKVLDVGNGSRSNGANIAQYTLHKGKNQQFRFKSAGGGYFFIQNVNSGKYLDIAGGGRHNGANVQQYQYHGGNNQRFRLKSAGGGYYYLQNRNSGKYLDIAGVSRNNGANCQQFSYNGGSNQRFRFIRVSGSSKPKRKITYTPPITPLPFYARFHVPAYLSWYKKAMRSGKSQQALNGSIVSVQVQFRRLDIHGNPDNFPSGDGDYYWEFDVNGDHVVQRSKQTTVSLSKNTRYNLSSEGGTSRTVRVASNGTIDISGWVMDSDGFLNGDDDHCGDFFINVPVELLNKNGSWYNLNRRFQGVNDSGQTIHVSLRLR